MIEAFEAGVAEGKGVITVDGRMIENLHVDNARRALAVAEAIAALGTDTRIAPLRCGPSGRTRSGATPTTEVRRRAPECAPSQRSRGIRWEP